MLSLDLTAVCGTSVKQSMLLGADECVHTVVSWNQVSVLCDKVSSQVLELCLSNVLQRDTVTVNDQGLEMCRHICKAAALPTSCIAAFQHHSSTPVSMQSGLTRCGLTIKSRLLMNKTVHESHSHQAFDVCS